MIKLKDILNEGKFGKNDVDTVYSKIEQFKEHTNYTDWYINGGCYAYAYAMMNLLQGAKLQSVGDDTSELAHVFVKWNGQYIDYNGMVDSKEDIISDIYLDGKPKWGSSSVRELKIQYNFSMSDVNKITNFFQKK